MTIEHNNITTLTVKELLDVNKNEYVIPVYQRNYAWGESEITQLVQDIIDSLPSLGDSSITPNYYLGTLVVSERRDGRQIIYETIDGQQRLTTLSLLAAAIKKNKRLPDDFPFTNINLSFDSRKRSTETLEAILNDNFRKGKDYNEEIKNGFQLVQKILKTKLIEHRRSLDAFSEFLFKSVKILRVPVPEETDLNHYFEVMNNRGEQLEKHEILKSQLLKYLEELPEKEKEIASECFKIIWEACSQMERYVQYGFSSQLGQRNLIFGLGNWDHLQVKDFDEICEKLADSIQNESTQETSTLDDIISGKAKGKPQEENEDTPDRFNSVINFQNFLLHVLRIQTEKDIPLEDKKLIDHFNNELDLVSDKTKFVKDFIFSLLKSKFLFDKYIIKREFAGGNDRWSLKRLKWYEGRRVSYVNTFGEEETETVNENRRLLMLLSMFHVSAPTIVYKHWLNAALYFLFYEENITSQNYEKYLSSVAKAFVFDRFLTKEDPKDYFEIIYDNKGNSLANLEDITLDKLSFHNLSNNLIFNYLDYLLWLQKNSENNLYKNFEFTFRSSVEHYYPQHPMEGHPELENKNTLHSFGNLCLIDHGKNSRLSNFMPRAKKEHYDKDTIDSIKQHIMMNEYKPEMWGENSIKEHEEKMIKVLLQDFYQDIKE